MVFRDGFLWRMNDVLAYKEKDCDASILYSKEESRPRWSSEILRDDFLVLTNCCF